VLISMSRKSSAIERPVGQNVGSNLTLAPKDLRLDIRDLHTSSNVIYF